VITAVDTNVLSDVIVTGAEWSSVSQAALRRVQSDGRLIVGEVVWAELVPLFDSSSAMALAMRDVGVDLIPMEEEAASLAGQIWAEYREGGGPRTRLVADFLVGAHASVQADRLLTRDRGFYRDYFTSLRVIDPTAS